jgi:thiol-disulfide isomerase/thioredoxin
MRKLASVLILLIVPSWGCSKPQALDPNVKPVVLRLVKADAGPTEYSLTKINANAHELTDLKGKVAVVDFWATWCTPCIAEIPKYNALKAKYAGKDFEMVGVTVESGSLEDIKPKVEEFQMKYQVVVGDDKVVEGFGGVIGFPTTFLVSKDGTIYKKYLGSPENKIEMMEKDIETLLGM